MVKKLIPILLIVLAAAAFSEEVLVEDYGYYLDIPEGWKLLDAKDPAVVSFTDKNHTAVFQIMTFPGERFSTAAESAAHLREKFKARGDEAAFTYQGKDALLADYTFKAGRHDARGWFLFLNGDGYDFALLAFTALPSYEVFHDLLLSCLDSFAPGEESRFYPGPISQFYLPFPAPKPRETSLPFRDRRLSFFPGADEPEANQTLIEREARILAGTKENFVKAWQRYYRIIYRDTFQRLAPLARGIEPILRQEAPGDKLPAALLSWFQGFSYTRTKTLSDFQSPLTCVLSASGDCDSLGMAYIILLHQLGYDAILLVSSKYSHGIAAVDVAGKGARYPFEGKQYLTAELTDKVDIGLIDRTMADPAGWIPVAFGRPVRE